ncbi:alpha-1,2-fucosyltransferase [Flavobacterium sp. WC2416]|uniref:Alpha-1,2-fucosyltransferase n=1 Tax=Flavobacterium sp. WC2416 TaxID=3234141 RepID=A0AB39WD56_9FLAO
MILIELQGGLGNQMFQFAFASVFAKKNRCDIKIDKSFFELKDKKVAYTPRFYELAIFNISSNQTTDSVRNRFVHLSYINKVKKKLGFNYPKIHQESGFNFQENALSIETPVYVKGYFQSYKYFEGYESLIKKVFSFPVEGLDITNSKLLSDIKNMKTISIHVRRGDYVQDKKTQLFHGNCSLKYYFDAISLLVSKNKDAKLIFFSDDSDWVKEQFQDLSYSKIFIDHNKNENSWKDMFLMSCCTHNIIANSSFSWWAAWLNENINKTVIAPKKWFAETAINDNDLIPAEWIRL